MSVVNNLKPGDTIFWTKPGFTRGQRVKMQGKVTYVSENKEWVEVEMVTRQIVEAKNIISVAGRE